MFSRNAIAFASGTETSLVRRPVGRQCGGGPDRSHGPAPPSARQAVENTHKERADPPAAAVRDENAPDEKPVAGVPKQADQAGLQESSVHPDEDAERKKGYEMEAEKTHWSRRF